MQCNHPLLDRIVDNQRIVIKMNAAAANIMRAANNAYRPAMNHVAQYRAALDNRMHGAFDVDR